MIKLPEQASEYLSAELGLTPLSVEIRASEQTYYDARTHTAYIREDATLDQIIHEVYGHALFSNQSEIGKRYRNMLTSLTKLEEELSLPQSTFTFRKHEGQRKITRNPDHNKPESKTAGCQHIVYYNEEDEEVTEYIKIRQEARDFYETIWPLQEGFAEWMETIVLQGLGENELLETRLKELEKRKTYLGFKKDEPKGIISLLYSMGFPKSNDLNIIGKFTEENIGKLSDYKFVVFYGSGKNDIDIMAVGGDVPRRRKNTIDFDSVTYSEVEFMERIRLFNLEAVDPVLTGKLLHGDETEFRKLQQNIRESKPGKDAIELAVRMSLEAFETSMHFFRTSQHQGRRTLALKGDIWQAATYILNQETTKLPSKELYNCINNISYSLSYMLSAQFYKEEKRATIFNELRSSNTLLNTVVQHMKDLKSKKESVSEEKISSFLDQTQKELYTILSKLR